jgi:hypothetical protein
MGNKIFQEFIRLNPGFMDQLDSDCELNFIEVGNYLYITCNLLTFGDLNYTVIYEPSNSLQSNQLYSAVTESKDEVLSYVSDCLVHK